MCQKYVCFDFLMPAVFVALAGCEPGLAWLSHLASVSAHGFKFKSHKGKSAQRSLCMLVPLYSTKTSTKILDDNYQPHCQGLGYEFLTGFELLCFYLLQHLLTSCWSWFIPL